MDAEQKYRDLSAYRIAIVFEENHRRIDYEMQDQTFRVAAHHYLIDAVTGATL